MKKSIIFALTLLCLVFIVFKLFNLKSEFRQSQHQLKQLSIANHELTVELAVSPQALSKGLGSRDSIGSDGMLFILPVRTVPSFWMKDMRFALDFVWIDGNQVVALTPHAEAQVGANDQDLKIYSPQLNATEVLEIPSGDIDRRQIRVGDSVTLSK